jgi:hypothetical protein
MLIMDLNFLRNYRDELIRMNRKKRGRPYRTAESYVRFLAVIRKERDRTYYKAKEECQYDKILRIQNLEQKWWDMVGGGWLRLQYHSSIVRRTSSLQEAEMD